jgi:ankyrin repeat protein
MAAVENNRKLFVEWLLFREVEVNKKMRTGWTALHAAAKKNNKDLIQILLQHGADKTITASHRDFGANVKPIEVTAEESTQDMLN